MFSRDWAQRVVRGVWVEQSTGVPTEPGEIAWPYSKTTTEFQDPYLGDFSLTRPQPPNEGLHSPAFAKWYLGDFT